MAENDTTTPNGVEQPVEQAPRTLREVAEAAWNEIEESPGEGVNEDSNVSRETSDAGQDARHRDAMGRFVSSEQPGEQTQVPARPDTRPRHQSSRNLTQPPQGSSSEPPQHWSAEAKAMFAKQTPEARRLPAGTPRRNGTGLSVEGAGQRDSSPIYDTHSRRSSKTRMQGSVWPTSRGDPSPGARHRSVGGVPSARCRSRPGSAGRLASRTGAASAMWTQRRFSATRASRPPACPNRIWPTRLSVISPTTSAETVQEFKSLRGELQGVQNHGESEAAARRSSQGHAMGDRPVCRRKGRTGRKLCIRISTRCCRRSWNCSAPTPTAI